MAEATKAESITDKMKEILDRTNYPHEITAGQRKYGPPTDWTGPQPGPGHEIYCGKVPKDVFEDELIPLFEKCGMIWDLRLMMDPLTGQSRGFCFVTFMEKRAAEDAVKQFDGYAIKGNKHLKVNISTPNCRLFVGNIPKSRSKEEIIQEFSKITEGLTDVIIYAVPDDPKKKNRGFAFLDYDCHKSASAAKKRLGGGRIKVFNCDIIVDWADPLAEPDEETMSKVKVLYVRNLKTDVTEEQLREKFEQYGKLEKVKKVRDYGFIHFYERDDAVKALEELNGSKINESELLITLAKPPIDAKTKEKRKIQHMMMLGRPDPYFGGGIGLAPGRLVPGTSRVRIPRPPLTSHAAFRAPVAYDLDYYGGYDPYYDAYAEDYDYYGYTGYEDYGYEDYDYYVPVATYPAPVVPAMPRARGRGLGLPGMAGRGHAGLGLRSPRGVPGLAAAGRGTRVLRGAMRAPFGRVIEAAGVRGAMAPRGVKRKAATDFSVAETKKPHTQDAWGAQPIAQQPLSQMATYSEAEWYQDSYSTLDGQEWG